MEVVGMLTVVGSLRFISALAVLIGFSLPHCAVFAQAPAGQIENVNVIEASRGYECADKSKSENHEDHAPSDCCDGCLLCQKVREYTPPDNSKVRPIAGSPILIGDEPGCLCDFASRSGFLLAIKSPLFEQAGEHARSVVKRE